MDRKKLIEDNLNLVYFVVRKYYPAFRNDEDIIQCGMLGLCNAARIWTEGKSAFSTYASLAISNEIIRELNKRNHRVVTFSINRVDSETDEEVDYLNLLVDDTFDDNIDIFNFDLFCETLNERDKRICYGLRNDMSYPQICEMVGCKRQTITDAKKRIKLKWRKFNENQD